MLRCGERGDVAEILRPAGGLLHPDQVIKAGDVDLDATQIDRDGPFTKLRVRRCFGDIVEDVKAACTRLELEVRAVPKRELR